MASLYESFVDQHEAIAPNTRKKHVVNFDKWRTFLSDMRIEDEWLIQFTPEQRTYFLSAFASCCRRNKYGKTKKLSLSGNTVKTTVVDVRSTFRSTLRGDPALDADHKISLFLTRQLMGYVDADPATKQQKALPFIGLPQAVL